MRQRILTLIIENYGLGLDEPLSLDTQLLELNIIDSSAFFDLIEILQSEFSVTVPLEEIKPENFATASDIAHMMNNLTASTMA
ncbi:MULTISPECIES: acyl carrier protein [unclassified Pseudovibrio]|uniref:acyl carrier protein n=1 Tax=unclassified Pseudovibrio TaxID=2627060 RepID=UPI0007AE7734|nr:MULTISPECIES: acyl carrier protein [unclassified Pseudovibrio]KZL24599.1 D-alanine--poly(phosphoribitol) ligase subunit 2 [Pseudovibrio sp. Ad37]KZL24639.1 D-alanine--poly(phosphoribitol) ligase subunit 2 [Pseudovibrio sp. WM33]